MAGEPEIAGAVKRLLRHDDLRCRYGGLSVADADRPDCSCSVVSAWRALTDRLATLERENEELRNRRPGGSSYEHLMRCFLVACEERDGLREAMAAAEAEAGGLIERCARVAEQHIYRRRDEIVETRTIHRNSAAEDIATAIRALLPSPKETR